MFRIKKVSSLVVSIVFFLSSTSSFAETTTSTTGNFSILKNGEVAPFMGVLFDPMATAIILTEGEHLEEQFRLKLEFELNKESTRNKLIVENLKIDLKTTEQTTKIIVGEKEKELEKLRKMALQSSDYTWFYVGSGFLGGVLVTILGAWAMGQASK
ncbi:MAG: hypothetical protein UT24_C0053G0002 [Candidatus Woesebacteria bacterium GW2011_GWB1_39_12]|uniref:Uncharacterized protein n=1 Tax=Candidatus Woesebacteria bacterium GW2011_GWB1_39_12 TaxID=1618574 RepID=A0A0G0M9V5_9BACT|nr:MAG: hypothetical protein UT24_C0053G0002 [Candidatus Woesebacteria bacterium GW2011_GWB1_39_12]